MTATLQLHEERARIEFFLKRPIGRYRNSPDGLDRAEKIVAHRRACVRVIPHNGAATLDRLVAERRFRRVDVSRWTQQTWSTGTVLTIQRVLGDRASRKAGRGRRSRWHAWFHRGLLTQVGAVIPRPGPRQGQLPRGRYWPRGSSRPVAPCSTRP